MGLWGLLFCVAYLLVTCLFRNIFLFLVLQDLNTDAKEKVMKKVKESLGQTLRDLNIFVKNFPQIDLNKLNFTTLSILSAIVSKDLEICSECSSMIVFREDKDLFIKNRTRTVLKLLLFWFDFL
jgi:hypothetical protein